MKSSQRPRKSAPPAKPRRGSAKASPVRTQPIRNFGALFGGSEAGEQPAGKANGKKPPAKANKATRSGKQARPSKNGKQPAPNDIDSGVGIAYSVIDDYIKQGRRMAEQVMPSREAAGNIARELPQVTERMFRYASDFASVWLEAMGMMAAGAARRGGDVGDDVTTAGAWATPLDLRQAPRRAEGPVSAAPLLRIAVRSKRPAAVVVQLAPGTGSASLEATAELSASVKRTRGLEANMSVFVGRVEVRVDIPDALAPGSYFGAFADLRSGTVVGSITLDVEK